MSTEHLPVRRPLPRAFDGIITFVARWAGPYASLLVTASIGLLIVVPLVAAFREIWEGLTTLTDGAQFDQPVHAWAVSIRQPWFDPIMAGFTLAAGRLGMPLIALAFAGLLSWRAKSWRPAILLVITGVGSLIFTSVSKTVAGRARPPAADMLPPIETSPSFPSGHTLNSTAVMLVVAYCAWVLINHRAAQVIATAGCVLFPIIVAFSRVYLGQHWFTDVMAAFALGAAWAAAVVFGHRMFLAVRERRRELPAAAVKAPKVP